MPQQSTSPSSVDFPSDIESATSSDTSDAASSDAEPDAQDSPSDSHSNHSDVENTNPSLPPLSPKRRTNQHLKDVQEGLRKWRVTARRRLYPFSSLSAMNLLPDRAVQTIASHRRGCKSIEGLRRVLKPPWIFLDEHGGEVIELVTALDTAHEQRRKDAVEAQKRAREEAVEEKRRQAEDRRRELEARRIAKRQVTEERKKAAEAQRQAVREKKAKGAIEKRRLPAAVPPDAVQMDYRGSRHMRMVENALDVLPLPVPEDTLMRPWQALVGPGVPATSFRSDPRLFPPVPEPVVRTSTRARPLHNIQAACLMPTRCTPPPYAGPYNKDHGTIASGLCPLPPTARSNTRLSGPGVAPQSPRSPLAPRHSHATSIVAATDLHNYVDPAMAPLTPPPLPPLSPLFRHPGATSLSSDCGSESPAADAFA